MKCTSECPLSCGTEMLPGDHVPVDRTVEGQRDHGPVDRTAEGQRDHVPVDRTAEGQRDHILVDRTVEGQRDHAQGDTCLISAEETPSSHVTRGNTIPTDLITSQPLPAAAPPPLEPPAAGVFQVKKPRGDVQKICPHCGLSSTPRVPEHRLSPLSPGVSRLQGSSLSVQSNSSSKKSKSRDSLTGSHKTAAAQEGSCLRLVLACLSCQCSVLLLGLLEACTSCLHALCSTCCHCCARCCAALQEVPLEDLNCHAHCHSVMFESCCEPTEFLEFCLECCDICHRS